MYYYEVLYTYVSTDIDARMSIYLYCSSQDPLDTAQVEDWLIKEVIKSTPQEPEIEMSAITEDQFATGHADYRMMF